MYYMALGNYFLISLIAISALLVVFIIILLITGRGSAGKQVAAMLKQNKSFEEILEYGKKKKLQEREIKLYFLIYTMQDFLKIGYNLDEIESMALDSGWPNDIVQIVINKLR